MTPIAHRIAKSSAEPVAKRRYDHLRADFDVLDGWHFFECSAVEAAAADLGRSMMRGFETCIDNRLPVDKAARLAFLPAPKTWIEYAVPQGCDDIERVAWLLDMVGGLARVRCVILRRDGGIGCGGTEGSIGLPLMGSEHLGRSFAGGSYYETATDVDGNGEMLTASDRITALAVKVYGLLALINTPRVIMRQQHMPHRGLERTLRNGMQLVGKFPLQGWTELRLEVAPPKVHESEPQEAHLTGTKALHFVRCHLRIKLGQLELVSAHWRGDAALGIKRTRYRLEFPKGRAA